MGSNKRAKKECIDPFESGCTENDDLRTFSTCTTAPIAGYSNKFPPDSLVCRRCRFKLLSKQKQQGTSLCCNPFGDKKQKHSKNYLVVSDKMVAKNQSSAKLEAGTTICTNCRFRILRSDAATSGKTNNKSSLKTLNNHDNENKTNRVDEAAPSKAQKSVENLDGVSVAEEHGYTNISENAGTNGLPEQMDRIPQSVDIPGCESLDNGDFEDNTECEDNSGCEFLEGNSLDNYSSLTSETDEQCTSDPDYCSPSQDKAATFESVNKCLEALCISPLLTSNVAEVSIKLKEAIASLKEKMEFLAGSKFYATDVCEACNDLVTGAVSTFHSSSEEFKYVILSSMPKDIPKLTIRKIFGCSRKRVAKAKMVREKRGPFSMLLRNRESTRKFSKKKTSLIRSFYRHPLYSRSLPGMRDNLLVRVPGRKKKQRVGKYRMYITIPELWKEFCSLNPNESVSLSKFQELRPAEVIPLGKSLYHNTCTCIYHENFDMQLEILGDDVTLRTVLDTIPCDQFSEKCMTGKCLQCPNNDQLNSLMVALNDTDTVTYYKWTHTDRTQKVRITESSDEYKETFKTALSFLLKHHFLVRQQNLFVDSWHDLNTAADRLGEVFVNVDFAQNYSFVYQDEVQSAHWSHPQATVHVFVIDYFYPVEAVASENQTYGLKQYEIVIISDHLEHNTVSYHAFLTQAMPIIKSLVSEVKTIRYISDGSSAQYKNWKSIINMMFHEKDFGCASTLEYFPTAHGKGACDRLAGNVKRSVRTVSLGKRKGTNQITTPKEMYQFLVEKDKADQIQNRTILFVSHETVETHYEKLLKPRFKNGKTIPGTKAFHSIRKFSETECEVRNYTLQDSSRIISLKKQLPTAVN